MLRAYLADMHLHGILLFSSVCRPALAKPGGAFIQCAGYIHNYALIYGFSNVPVASYAVVPSRHFLAYRSLETRSRRIAPFLASARPLTYLLVREAIEKLLRDEDSIYVYPAQPVEVHVKKFLMSAKGSGYAEVRGSLKTVYPRMEHYVALVPPSRFKTIVLASGRKELPKVMFVRIGMKRLGIFKVVLRECRIDRRVPDPRWSSLPVNLYDTELFGYDVMDFVKVLETPSKPTDSNGRIVPQASVVGYALVRDMYIVRCYDAAGHGEEYIVPLPK